MEISPRALWVILWSYSSHTTYIFNTLKCLIDLYQSKLSVINVFHVLLQDHMCFVIPIIKSNYL